MGDMFGGGGSSSGTSTSTSSTQPWAGQQPYLTAGFKRAKKDILNSPTEVYPNSTVVPFAPQTEAALQATQNRALMGSPVQSAGNQAYLDTIQGDYLDANPYFQGAMDAANQATVRNYQRAVQPGIDAAFSDAGRYGSGQHFDTMQGSREALAGEIANTNTMAAYNNFNQERQRQMAAAAGAPQMAAADYGDMDRLMGVGQAYEGQAGATLQDEMQRFYAEQNNKKQALADYMALVGGGNYGGMTTMQQPIYSSGSGLTNMLGLGALGLDAYKSGLFG